MMKKESHNLSLALCSQLRFPDDLSWFSSPPVQCRQAYCLIPYLQSPSNRMQQVAFDSLLGLACLHACMYVVSQDPYTAMLLMGAPPSRCNVIFKETSLPLPLLALLTHLYSFYCMHVRFWPSFVHLIPMAYAGSLPSQCTPSCDSF